MRRVAPDAVEAMARYPWPGNVRELVNIIERAMLLANGDEITLADLPESLRAPAPGEADVVTKVVTPHWAGASSKWTEESLEEVRRRALEAIERAYLEALLSQTGGRIGLTASRAGIQPRSLFEKMRRYGLRKEDYRKPAKKPEPVAAAKSALRRSLTG